MSSFSVALLGIAHVHVGDHLDVIEADPGLRLTAVWDPDQERARSLEPELVVADPVTAATRADIVVVDSVTSAHVELVPVAAAAGKAVFVEKPLGRSGAEAQALAAAIDRAGVPFATGFFLRCLPALRRARALLQEGRLGRLVSAHARFSHPGLDDGAFAGPTAWMLDPDEAGMGGFGDLGTHLLDALSWLRPGHRLEVEHARVVTAAGVRSDVGGSALLSWDDEVPAAVHTSWLARPGGLHLALEGTAATATVQDGTLTLTGGRSQSWTAEPPDARRALQAFVADLRGQPAWEAPSTSQAVRVARLLDEAQRMADSSLP